MKTYSVTELGDLDSITRVTLREKLDLTGAEISVNRLPACADNPFACFNPSDTSTPVLSMDHIRTY
ncbi:MAG TPA: hypothetical protein DDW27_08645 [Bacteroidales bacterium]|nr:hypothetical protein [Bacteroidales bacterium]